MTLLYTIHNSTAAADNICWHHMTVLLPLYFSGYRRVTIGPNHFQGHARELQTPETNQYMRCDSTLHEPLYKMPLFSEVPVVAGLHCPVSLIILLILWPG